MNHKSYDVAALLGSRICHDLISPIGAIGNGVELLSMVGAADGAEVSLISDSVSHANARIRYFRIAFGAGSDMTHIGASEILAVLEDLAKTGRMSVQWEITRDVTRNEAKLAFLLIMCLEGAMPYGGVVRITCADGAWSIEGIAEKLKVDPELWGVLQASDDAVPEITPAQVQFLLAADQLRDRAPGSRVEIGSGRIEITY